MVVEEEAYSHAVGHVDGFDAECVAYVGFCCVVDVELGAIVVVVASCCEDEQ